MKKPTSILDRQNQIRQLDIKKGKTLALNLPSMKAPKIQQTKFSNLNSLQVSQKRDSIMPMSHSRDSEVDALLSYSDNRRRAISTVRNQRTMRKELDAMKQLSTTA